MKKFVVILITIVFMAFILIGCFYTYLYFTDKKDMDIKRLEEPIFNLDEYPKVDGSIATLPLSQAFIKNFTKNDNAQVKHTTTNDAYKNLINGNVDLILVTNPSEEQQKLAMQNNVQLEIRQVVNEGLVFYINEENPIKNLSLSQIQKIYTGEITNWKEVGGDDAEINAYQREPNSENQIGMTSLVMKGLTMKKEIKENIIQDSSSILNLVSNYDNGKYSIGYSYYNYAKTMYNDKEIADVGTLNNIKYLSVNGVEPNNETIKNGKYPIRTAYYIIINSKQPENSNTRKLVEAMVSERGQNVAQEAGYVGIK